MWVNKGYTLGQHIVFDTICDPSVLFAGYWVNVNLPPEVCTQLKKMQECAFYGLTDEQQETLKNIANEGKLS